MRTYVLFIYGDFEDHEEITFFIDEIFIKIPSVSELKYILEEGKNLILVFDSDKTHQNLVNDMTQCILFVIYQRRFRLLR